jgi:hypothetical protein
MTDLALVPLSSTPRAPIAREPDLLDAPAPRPARSDDPFGPAVVIAPSAPQPALVVYDAQGRLTTSVPEQTGVLPPARIDVSHPDAPRNSLIYTR